MEQQVLSIRPFLGAMNFETSRRFYRDIGFTETLLSEKLSLFTMGAAAFYLQDAYVREWTDNTMVFVEVKDTDEFYRHLSKLDWNHYGDARLLPVVHLNWGSECFVHDPAGILLHFGAFR